MFEWRTPICNSEWQYQFYYPNAKGSRLESAFKTDMVTWKQTFGNRETNSEYKAANQKLKCIYLADLHPRLQREQVWKCKYGCFHNEVSECPIFYSKMPAKSHQNYMSLDLILRRYAQWSKFTQEVDHLYNNYNN